MKKASSNQAVIFTIAIILVIGVALYFFLFKPVSIDKEPKQTGMLEICTRLPRIKIDKGRQPALALNYELEWSSSRTLYVYFLGNNKPSLIAKIIKTANEWSKHCGMQFKDTIVMSDSQIRVTFKEGGYSSVVGIEAVQEKYRRKFTMCLQGLDTLADDNIFRRVVLHEFGHAIGLEHELQNPSSDIPWDTAAVYKYYFDHYKWKPDSVLKHVLKKIRNVDYTDFDSTSIMVYAVPDTLTKGRYQIEWPRELSANDQSAIGKWYQKK